MVSSEILSPQWVRRIDQLVDDKIANNERIFFGRSEPRISATSPQDLVTAPNHSTASGLMSVVRSRLARSCISSRINAFSMNSSGTSLFIRTPRVFPHEHCHRIASPMGNPVEATFARSSLRPHVGQGGEMGPRRRIAPARKNVAAPTRTSPSNRRLRITRSPSLSGRRSWRKGNPHSFVGDEQCALPGKDAGEKMMPHTRRALPELSPTHSDIGVPPVTCPPFPVPGSRTPSGRQPPRRIRRRAPTKRRRPSRPLVRGKRCRSGTAAGTTGRGRRPPGSRPS